MTNQQGAPEAPSYEHQRAIMEGERNASLAAFNHDAHLSRDGERLYETGFTNGWNRLAALVEAQQPAPSAAAAVVVYEQKENEMQVWFRPARMHGHPERTPIKATITKDRGNGIVDLTYDDGEFSGNARAVPNALRLPRNVREQVAVWWDVGFEMDFQTAVDNSLKKKKDDPPPQPSPTPQADSAPSAATPVGEAPLPLLVRDIAADLGTTPIQVCTALAQLGFGGHSVNMAVTPRMAKSLRAYFASPTPQADSQPAPIDMVLHCPKCGVQHIDASEPPVEFEPGAAQWSNPPHRSHLCHGCGHIWRPADVPTNGVEAVKTTGKADSPIAASAQADSVTAPAGGGVAGPSKWTDEEIADGKRGIRWVTEGVIHGRPTDHDVREYLMRTPAMRGCLCDDCRTFYAPTPPAQAADSGLEDAARYRLVRRGQHWSVINGIGDTLRGEELDAAVDAARKQGGA